MTILDALDDPVLFAPHFTPEPAWGAWRAFLTALFALPMSEDQLALYRTHTGRQNPPEGPAREAWLVVGRRGGKSRIAALVAVFLACFRDYQGILAPGERGTVMVIAADRKQARVVFRYIAGLIDGTPMLTTLVEHRTAESIHLTNRVVIEVHTASYRAVRGYTVLAAVADELSFWIDAEGSSNPASEIITALRPAMATVPEALLLCISSPYARRGIFWESYRRHHGQDGDPILTWQADTRAMNPTVDERVIAEAYEQDESAARAEYGAEFRRDIEAFIPREVVEALVVQGRGSLPPVQGFRYVAFVDPSGGSQDSMTLAVAHSAHGGKTVLDLVVERRAPFGPDEVVQEFAWHLAPYEIARVTGDRYAGEWPRERFRKHGVVYEISEYTKSELYQATLPLLMSRQVTLLDLPRLVGQLSNLERTTSRVGRDTIGPPPRGHDDVANAAAGALVLAARRRVRALEGYRAQATAQGRSPCRMHGRVRCPACEPNWTLQDLLRGGVGSGLWL